MLSGGRNLGIEDKALMPKGAFWPMRDWALARCPAVDFLASLVTAQLAHEEQEHAKYEEAESSNEPEGC